MAIKNISIEYELFNKEIENTIITTTSTSGSSYSSATVVDDEKKLLIDWQSAETASSDGTINTQIVFEFSKPQAVCGFRLSGNVTNVELEYKDMYSWNTRFVGDVENDKSFGVYSDNEGDGVYGIKLKVKKIVAGDTYAIIDYVQFSVIEQHNDSDLFNVNASKAVFLAAEEGNGGTFLCSHNKINSVFSEASDFELNHIPDSIKKGKIITLSVSTDTEMIFSKYITTDFINDDGAIKIEAYDLLMTLNETYFRIGKVYTQGRSLADWAREVAQDAGVTVILDSSLENVISYGYITEVPHREAFRLIAEAANAYLTIDSSGRVAILKDISEMEGHYNSPEKTEAETLSITDKDNIQGIQVNEYRFVEQPNLVELGYIESMQLASSPQHIDITYANYPVKTETVEVYISAGTITNKRVFSDRIEFDISGTGSTYITIIGIPYDVINTVSKYGSENNVKVIKDNFLIGEYNAFGASIAQHQYDMVANKNEYVFNDLSGELLQVPFEISFMYFLPYDITARLIYIYGVEINKTYSDEDITIFAVER